MTEAGFQALKQNIVQRLSAGLDRRLTYHNLAHTLDVLNQAERISGEEKIADPAILMQVKIAALYHDTGFLFTYRGHEEKSCEILLEDFAGYELEDSALKNITGMIMATKIPQRPSNLMEEIICDADLDYLGRDDYPPISDSLKNEFLAYGIIHDAMEWDPLQIDFFEKHHYFTQSSRAIRHPRKMEYLALLKQR